MFRRVAHVWATAYISLFLNVRHGCKTFFKLCIRGNIIVHLSVMEFFICNHIKISRTRQTEKNRLFFACFLAFESFINRLFDCVAALGCRKNALNSCELLRCLKYGGLGNGNRLRKSVMIELGKGLTHTVIPQSAGVVRRRNKVAAESVHLCEGANHTRVTKIIRELSARETRTG